jgi:hypothetical protein
VNNQRLSAQLHSEGNAGLEMFGYLEDEGGSTEESKT